MKIKSALHIYAILFSNLESVMLFAYLFTGLHQVLIY